MPSPHVPVTGGCLCGAVRYESEEAPVLGSYCHCKMCQKGYGGLYQAIVKFSGSNFRFTSGNPTYYRSSRYGKRGFCASCGSPIAFLYENNPSVYVLVGSLDHPEDWPLTRDASWGQSYHWFVEDKVAWERIDDGLPQAGEPPSGTIARSQFGATPP
jgi:hypothetical protein